MVLKDLVEDIKDIFNLNKTDKQKKFQLTEKNAINELQQGMILLQNRNNIFQKVKQKYKLLEKFDNTTLNNVSDYISSLKKSNIYNLVSSIERGDYDDFIDSNESVGNA